jgi:ligand-binding SRPBCC domain-containing protein
VIILTTSCNFKTNTTNNRANICDTLSSEEFDVFLHRFYSDSIFQINRIVFPLTSQTETEIERRIDKEKALNYYKADTTKFTPLNKNNWKTLNDYAFKNDSVAVIDGIKYKRRFSKTDKFVVENILYADPERIMIVSKFQLINKKWYMIDFQDGFTNE